MAKTIITQFDNVAKTQNVLYYNDASVLVHSARFREHDWDSLTNSILDWTRDGVFAKNDTADSVSDTESFSPVIGSLLDVYA